MMIKAMGTSYKLLSEVVLDELTTRYVASYNWKNTFDCAHYLS